MEIKANAVILAMGCGEAGRGALRISGGRPAEYIQQAWRSG